MRFTFFKLVALLSHCSVCSLVQLLAFLWFKDATIPPPRNFPCSSKEWFFMLSDFHFFIRTQRIIPFNSWVTGMGAPHILLHLWALWACLPLLTTTLLGTTENCHSCSTVVSQHILHRFHIPLNGNWRASTVYHRSMFRNSAVEFTGFEGALKVRWQKISKFHFKLVSCFWECQIFADFELEAEFDWHKPGVRKITEKRNVTDFRWQITWSVNHQF